LTRAFVFVNTETGKEKEVAEGIRTRPNVLRVIEITSGAFDLIVELEAPVEELRDTITWQIRKMTFVRSTLTSMVSSSWKSE